MRKTSYVLLIIAIVLFVALSATIFFACKSEKNVDIRVDGECYRGAIVPISANVSGFTEEADVKFYIKEDYKWVFISGGNLVFSQSAEVGKTVTLCVKVDDLVFEKSVTVGSTKIEQVEVKVESEAAAGAGLYLDANITPTYATDVNVTYKIVKGEDIASIDGDILSVEDAANYTDELSVVAIAGGVESEPKKIKITTIQPESIKIEATSQDVKRGESTKLSVSVTPKTCTLGMAELHVEESEYYTYSAGVLTVAEDAPIIDVPITATLGRVSDEFVLHIVKTPVEVVNAVADKGKELKKGDVVTVRTEVYPLNANFREVSYSIAAGEEYVRFDGESFEVTTDEIGKEIVFVAEADGVRHSLNFVTVAIPVERIKLSSSDFSVNVGDERTLSVEVIPSNAYVFEKKLSVIEGEDFAAIDGDKIRFTKIGSGLTEVIVRADYDGKTSEITFYVVPISVEKVEISTAHTLVDLEGGDVIEFVHEVTPLNASYKTVTYHFSEDGSYGTFDGSVLTLSDKPPRGSVYVYAVSADGVRSNLIKLDIAGNLENVTPLSWSSVDGNPSLFDGITSLRLNLTSLPKQADCCTVVISDDVEYLEIIGGYEREEDAFENLFFYFLTSDFVKVKLYSLGIKITCGLNGSVMDFGNLSSVVLDYDGVNVITGGSSYTPYTVGYTVDGVSSSDSNAYLLKNGMDGFNGLNGGDAINASVLTISGSGSLTLTGGNGADGTNGGNGLEGKGNGGSGGVGGDGGHAVFADELRLNNAGSLYLKGGNAGRGGLGGVGVQNGLSGEDGSSSAIFTNSKFEDNSHTAVIVDGAVRSSEVRLITYVDHKKLLENYYKITIHYGNDYYNPYSQYKMEKQTSESAVITMLYALEYALSIFPKNLYFELQKDSALDIYLVKTIKRSTTNGTIYGLTNNSNKMWLSYFETRLRGVFYSTHYNIYIHELFHVLTFGMGQLSDNPMKSGLPSFNLGYGYTTSSAGVYDPLGSGYRASNSAFLTTYSKSNFNEDISDNMSLICMLTNKADFIAEDMPIYKKVAYISREYEEFYDNLTSYTKVAWKRFLEAE